MTKENDFIIENGVLKKYVGKGGDIVIPKEITAIGNYAFSSCEQLKSVTIPHSIESLGYMAFIDCSNLEKVDILGEINDISDFTFCHCSQLKEFHCPQIKKQFNKDFLGDTIPEGLIPYGFTLYVSLSDGGLKQYILTSKVWDLINSDIQTKIFCERHSKSLHDAYQKCVSGQQAESMATELVKNLSEEKSSKLCNTAATFFILFHKVLTDETIKELYISIKESKGAEKSLKMLKENCGAVYERLEGNELNNKEKNIQDNAIDFEYSIVKNKAVKITKYIGNSTTVYIPAKIEGLPVETFAKDAFRKNDFIEKVVFPESVSQIPQEMFFGCSNLKEVIIPEGLVSIDEKAFRNCINLKKIVIPQSVTEIEEDAFECYRSLMGCGGLYWNGVETIEGIAGSAAEAYAIMNNIRFVPTNVSQEEREALEKYRFHYVEDGVSLDHVFVDESDDCLQDLLERKYTKTMEIPNEIMGKPVVEISADFQLLTSISSIEKEENIKYAQIAETVFIPQNLQRICCKLKGRGIDVIKVDPNNTHLIFDEYGWYDQGGKRLVDNWKSNYFDFFSEQYLLEKYTVREGTIEIADGAFSDFKVKEMVIPASVSEIGEGSFADWLAYACPEVICGFADSCAENYALSKNWKFKKL